MLLISAISVVAHEHEDELDNDAVEKMDKASEKSKSVRQTIEDRVTQKKELLERAKLKREQTKEAFKTAKDELKEAREKAKESRKELQSLKQKTQNCKGIESDDCKKTRRDAKTHAAKFVDGATEQVFTTLQRAKEDIQASNKTEDKKAELMADFDEKIEKLNKLRQKQGQIQAQSTTKEVKEAAKNIKEFWKQHKEQIKKQNLKIKHERFGGVIIKAEKLQERLQKQLETFEQQGKDTTTLESQITIFNNKISEAKTLNDEARTFIENGNMKEATDKMREAHQKLKEAQQTLKEIKNTVRAQQTLTTGLQEGETA